MSDNQPDTPGDNASGEHAVERKPPTVPASLMTYLYRAKALSERLLAVMAEREERLREIKERVSSLESTAGGAGAHQGLLDAEKSLKDAHTRMKAVLADLGKELEEAGMGTLPPSEGPLLLEHSGQGDEVAYLYKQLLLTMGAWKAEQNKTASERAAELAKQVQALAEQVAKERSETDRLRRNREALERLRDEKQRELDSLNEDNDENHRQQ